MTQSTLANRRRQTRMNRFKRDRVMLLLVVPGFLYFVIFHWVPLLGNVVAFIDYKPYLGFLGSEWVGLQNFQRAFESPSFWYALRNTLVITVVQLVMFFPLPIALALFLNSLISRRLRSFVQSVVYLPHFLGWVIIVALFGQIFGASGLFPRMLDSIGISDFYR